MGATCCRQPASEEVELKYDLSKVPSKGAINSRKTVHGEDKKKFVKFPTNVRNEDDEKEKADNFTYIADPMVSESEENHVDNVSKKSRKSQAQSMKQSMKQSQKNATESTKKDNSSKKNAFTKQKSQFQKPVEDSDEDE